MHARTDAAAEKLLVQNVPCTTLKSTQGGGTTTVLSMSGSTRMTQDLS